MKVTELRTLLSQRGLSSVGAKQDLVERLATATAGVMEEAQEERHAGAFQDSSPTRLDTAAFAMASAEESTPVDSTMMRLASGGKEHVCLDTVATNIATAEEIGQDYERIGKFFTFQSSQSLRTYVWVHFCLRRVVRHHKTKVRLKPITVTHSTK